MPTACSPRNYASCTSMIGGRLRSVQIPAEGSDSHPFATCVCPIPVSVFHFPFFSLYGPTSFHQKSCHISPFSPAPPSVSRHTFLHFSSPLHRPFVLLHRCLSYPPCTLSFFHIIMYAHVCGCGSATIITASDGTPLSLYDVCRFLSKQQWRHILKLLEQEGIHIERIEAYEYPEARDIKHLFICFKKEKEDTPFYLLSPEIFSKLTNTIIQEYSSNIK